MSHRSSLAILLAVFVGSLMMQATEPPQEGYPLPEDAALPEPAAENQPLPLPGPASDVPMEQYLRRFIPPGDLVGGGIHEVIQARGSVLDHFPTEEQLGLASETEPATDLDFGPNPSQSILSAVSGSASARSQAARAAEQLLKSARMLEKLDVQSDHQRKFIDRLRVEARNLLSE